MERFWSKVDKSGGPDACWRWKACLNNKGYGYINMNGPRELAHRLSYRLTNGGIPQGMCVLHKCDNPACCNPAHLMIGTHKDNVRDRVAKGRTRVGVGERSGATSLTNEQVWEIRKAVGTTRAIGAEYGVSHTTVRAIKRRTHWKHLPEEINEDRPI